MNVFPCTQCGACCKLAGYVKTFREPIKPGTAECMHLDSANRCVIYSDRPDGCRIKPGTYRDNAEFCNMLQYLTSSPSSKRLKILEIPEWA